MIIEYYKGFIHIEKLIEMTNTGRNGTTAYDLVTAAKQLGFESYGIKYDLEKSITLPAIAHVILNKSYNHFIVIYHINYEKNYLIIADPSDKLKKITFKEFKKIFTGNVIIMYPIKTIEREKKITLTHFLKPIVLNKKNIILILLSLITILLTLTNLIIFKQLFYKINFTQIIILLFISLVKYILINIKNHYTVNISLNIYKQFINETFSKIIHLPYKYYRKHTTGEVISRINDVDIIVNIIPLTIRVIMDIIILIVCGILLLKINLLLFILSLFIILFYTLLYLYFHKKNYYYLELYKNNRCLLDSYMTESISGFESIKGQNLEEKIIEKFENKNNHCLKTLKKYQDFKNNINNVKQLLNDISLILILGVGILLIQNQTIDFASLLLFYTLFSYFLEPIINLIENDLLLQEINLATKRIIELQYKENQKNYPLYKGKIMFKNTFIEQEELKLLNNVNIEIKQNDKIMIIGKSGSGKSTILKTLKQYYKSNNIYINDKNLNHINFKENITYISQNETLFTDTLYNNILVNRKIKEEELMKIISICHIQEIINKNPLGLNMLIEENGFNLSGGERQRIILARALVNKTPYLLIDEGLSEVDIDLERKIIKDLIQNYKNKTILIVSHRTDNIDLFDKVLKVEKEVEMLEKNKGGVVC